MNNVPKYKNFTQKFLEYCFLFLACFFSPNVYPAQIPPHKNVVITSITNYTLKQKNSYSISYNNHNIIFISTGSDVLIYNGNNWKTVPMPELCLLALDSLHNKIFIATETFIGTLGFNEKDEPMISKIITINRLNRWCKPEKLYTKGDDLYLRSKYKL